MKTLLLAAAAVITLAQSAHASIIPTLDGVTPDGSDFKFSYDGQLSGDQGLVAGDKLVIVDFAGYVTGSIHSRCCMRLRQSGRGLKACGRASR